MKNRIWIPLVVGFVGLTFIFSCKTSSAYLYQLGWTGDQAYVIKVQGIWDRSSYYVDGERNDVSDLGKIGVSRFELRRQAEIFARTRALFAFQEAMEDYFGNIENHEAEDKEQKGEDESTPLDVPEEETVPEEEVIEEDSDGSDSEVDKIEELQSENIDDSLPTITQPSRTLIAGNQKVKVFYEDPNQAIKTPPLVEETPAEPETETTLGTSVQVDSNSQIKKTINFQQVYDKVDLKITLISKTYTEQDDVEIFYLFSGKNLKQELASAFNVSSEEIELRK